MLQKTPIPAFTNNYFWALHNHEYCIIVDPGAAQPVLDFLQTQQLPLLAILVTHSHHDHIDGISELLRHYPVQVYGPASINGVTHPVNDGDSVTLLQTGFSVMAVPGHTLDHIAWYCADEGALYCGDTLFGAGCGRIFNGTMTMLFHSLQKIAGLPGDTRFYCAHEYTVANLQFALAVEPDNKAIHKRLLHCENLRQHNLCTLPGTIAEELQTNPFLRIRENTVINRALEHGATTVEPVDIFIALRTWKNQC